MSHWAIVRRKGGNLSCKWLLWASFNSSHCVVFPLSLWDSQGSNMSVPCLTITEAISVRSGSNQLSLAHYHINVLNSMVWISSQ